MSHKLTRSIFAAMLALALALFAARAQAAPDIEPTFEDQKSSVDKQDKLHLDAVADLNAQVAKVFDALSNPEKVAKYNPQVTGVKVLSHTDNTKVVEFQGQTIPIPNAPKSLQVKYTFDPAKNTITAESTGKALVQFRADYLLKPSKDGKSTEIHYTSVSSNPGKVLGMDTPEFMRREASISTLMNILRNSGKYIQNGGK